MPPPLLAFNQVRTKVNPPRDMPPPMESATPPLPLWCMAMVAAFGAKSLVLYAARKSRRVWDWRFHLPRYPLWHSHIRTVQFLVQLQFHSPESRLGKLDKCFSFLIKVTNFKLVAAQLWQTFHFCSMCFAGMLSIETSDTQLHCQFLVHSSEQLANFYSRDQFDTVVLDLQNSLEMHARLADLAGYSAVWTCNSKLRTSSRFCGCAKIYLNTR